MLSPDIDVLILTLVLYRLYMLFLRDGFCRILQEVSFCCPPTGITGEASTGDVGSFCSWGFVILGYGIGACPDFLNVAFLTCKDCAALLGGSPFLKVSLWLGVLTHGFR